MEHRGATWLLVRYPGGAQRWEADQRNMGPWHSRGKTRFHFTDPPLLASAAPSDAGEAGGAAAEAAGGGGGAAGAEHVARSAGTSVPWRAEYRRLVETLPSSTALATLRHHR